MSKIKYNMEVDIDKLENKNSFCRLCKKKMEKNSKALILKVGGPSGFRCKLCPSCSTDLAKFIVKGFKSWWLVGCDVSDSPDKTLKKEGRK